MPSCSVHHCVLFLLTLTLTTDPGAAAVVPIYANLHQPVILPCEAQCSGRAKWSLDSNRDDVFARCDQTSCTSEKQGFNMSHDQFKRGDLSLTITNPDYSMRNTYTCECSQSDYATVRLRISTVSSVVQMSPGENLKLDLSVPESVKVIYRGSDSADGVQICNVTDRTLQCHTEYTPRTSLSNSELTLRVWRGESGTYTIRNHEEDIRVYAVSVSGLTTGETAGIVILVLFLVLLIAGVMYYMWRKAEREKEETERKRREVESDKKAVNDLMDQALLKPPVEMMAALQQVEEKIKALEQKYRGDSEHSEHVTLFCNSKRSELVKRQMEEVDEDIKQTEEKLGYSIYSPPRDVTNMLQQVEQKINNLEQNSRGDRVHSGHVTLFCNKKREELQQCREMYETQLQGLRPLTGQVKSDMVKVYDLINETVHRAAVDEAELQRVEKKINGLEEEYSTGDREYSHSVRMFCYSKREYLRLYREVFKNTSLQSVIEKLRTEIKAVDDLIKNNKDKPWTNMQEVLQKINELELKYTWSAPYYYSVTSFCAIKRVELKFYRKVYGTQMESRPGKVKTGVEAVDDLIKQAQDKPPVEQEELLQKAKEKIDELIKKYPDFEPILLRKKHELRLCRSFYGMQIGSQQPGMEEVMKKMEEVNEHINQLKQGTAGNEETEDVEKKINELEKTCREESQYYKHVRLLCKKKRTDLELCSKLDLIQLGFEWFNIEESMEKVVKTLNDAKWRADHNRTVSPKLLSDMNKYVSFYLDQINVWCSEQRVELHEFKQEPSHGVRDNKMIQYMEKHLSGLELWCAGKQYELEKYREKLQSGGSDEDPQTPYNEETGNRQETDRLLV